jgi:GNAT superfamily N-acetyltransferase
VELRALERDELRRVAEIDRSEPIDAIYVQQGGALTLVEGDYSSPPWSPHGDGEHSVAGVLRAVEDWCARGGATYGAFEGERLVALGVVVPELHQGVAQLAFLYVTAGRRGTGVGTCLTTELEEIARSRGAATMVVSATPSRNTIDFYRGRGYAPSATPLPELLELEPEDVHLEKRL